MYDRLEAEALGDEIELAEITDIYWLFDLCTLLVYTAVYLLYQSLISRMQLFLYFYLFMHFNYSFLSPD
jgi:hypothetical protein